MGSEEDAPLWNFSIALAMLLRRCNMQFIYDNAAEQLLFLHTDMSVGCRQFTQH